ncbi:hypothetical protein EDD17DRAFT_1762857 [Pisolithus thermaeus]|nr:hypothetical protein EDD17DRAFT_1762857 [Pisolithus thermaeus]
MESCRRYYYVSPIFKVLQTMVSQAILGFRSDHICKLLFRVAFSSPPRTFNISGRDERVRNFLVVYYAIAVTFEWFLNLYHRTPEVVNVSLFMRDLGTDATYHTLQGSCISGTPSGSSSSWIFYLVAICYDLVTLGISTVQLFQYETHFSRFNQLTRVLLYDGLIFFVALSAVNVLNLILYQGTNVVAQSTAPSLGYAVVWIMSQRILIHLREVATEKDGNSRSITILTRRVGRERDVELPSRSQFESQKSQVDRRPNDRGLDVRITVQQTVTADYSTEELGPPPDKET